MANHQDTIWERYLKEIFNFFIDGEAIQKTKNKINWEKLCQILGNPNIIYPEYYTQAKFHGIEGGYLNADAAVTYDPITQYLLLPNETWVRQGVMENLGVKPRKIIDLGCGTGSTTLILKKAFPNSEVIGLDLSTYMLVMADYKAQKAGLEIQWLHGNAEHTNLPEGSFDLVTASLLFHETPIYATKKILQESFRILKPGGELIILDGNQKTLRHTEWLKEIFEEPYIKEYAAGSLDAWMGAAGFEGITTEDWWWTNQITRGIKPTPVKATTFNTNNENLPLDSSVSTVIAGLA